MLQEEVEVEASVQDTAFLGEPLRDRAHIGSSGGHDFDCTCFRGRNPAPIALQPTRRLPEVPADAVFMRGAKAHVADTGEHDHRRMAGVVDDRLLFRPSPEATLILWREWIGPMRNHESVVASYAGMAGGLVAWANADGVNLQPE